VANDPIRFQSVAEGGVPGHTFIALFNSFAYPVERCKRAQAGTLQHSGDLTVWAGVAFTRNRKGGSSY